MQVGNPIETVIAKYQAAEWTAVKAPKDSINDIVATKTSVMHFVQVDTGQKPEARASDLAKNDFVQNAFSNKAIPVRAIVNPKGKVVFTNTNTGARVIVRGPKKKSAA